MISRIKILTLIFIFSLLNISAYAQNKVVVIPMSGDDLKPLANIITVAKENGDFTDPVTALNAIGSVYPPADSANPYLIVIAAGVYELTEQLVMKPNVSIVGSGPRVTKLTGSISSSGVHLSAALVVTARYSSLRDLSIENAGGTDAYSIGIYNSDDSAISGVSLILSRTNFQYGIYNFSTNSVISNITVNLVNGIDSYGIYNDQSSPMISNAEVFVSSGSNTYGVYNASSSPMISNVSLNVFDGRNAQYGIYNDQSSPMISNMKIQVSYGSSNQYGIYSTTDSSPTVSNMKINVSVGLVGEGNSKEYGIYNATDTSSVKVDNSAISATTNSIWASTGNGNNETYISDSILTGNIAGNPKCSFVFKGDGTELDKNCTAF